MSEQKEVKEPKKAKTPREPKVAKVANAAKGKSSGRDAGDAGAVEKKAAGKPAGPSRLRAYYRDTVVNDLTQKFGYKTVMQVPHIDKIVLNMGVGEAVADKKIMDHAVSDMTKIAGQKPLVTKSRKAIASFKIREAQNVLQHKLNRPFELINKLHGFPTDVIGQARIDYTLDAASLNTT